MNSIPSERSGATNVQTIEHTESKGNILVVDDTPPNLRLLAAMLSDDGYHVRPVTSGRLALQAIESELPDLILLDINMPEMNGYAVCETLKEDPKTRDLPIIFISALTETIDKVVAFELGGVDYVTKPFQREEVLARVDTHLRLTRLNRENIAARKAAEQAAEAKSRFLSSMSHELRTPLTAIMGLAELLKFETDGPLADQQKEFVNQIELSAQDLLALIDDILDMARLDSHGIKANWQTFSAPTCLQRTADLMATQFQKQGLSHTVEIDPAAGDMVGDERKIKQILLNLIGNAVKFTPKGGKVTMRVLPEGNGVRFEVADTGIGIPADECERVFSEFYRLRRDDASNTKGTGLGLALVRRLVEIHGGDIGVHSVEGEGSTFWFTIPQNTAG